MKNFRVLFFAALFLCSFRYAAKADSGFHAQRTDFSLFTIYKGHDLYTRFGHSVLALKDRFNGNELLLNWGVFDFKDPVSFAVTFYKYKPEYKLARMNREGLIRLYRDYEHRRVIEQKLSLSNGQKKILLDRINWNLKSENIYYKYDYHYDNCSTRIRDYLDEALGGKIKEKFDAEVLNNTFRKDIDDRLNKPPFIAFSLYFLMNADIDFNISKWQQMYLPVAVSQYLSQFPNPETGENLLGASELIVDKVDVPSSPIDPFILFAVFASILVFWSILLIGPRIGQRIKSNSLVYKWNVKTGIRTLGAFGSFFSIWFFIYSSVMITSWVTSDHTDLHHNMHLFFMQPSDIFFLGVFSKWLWFGEYRFYKGKKLSLILRSVFILKLSLLIVGIGIILFGGSDQLMARGLKFVYPTIFIVLAKAYLVQNSIKKMERQNA